MGILKYICQCTPAAMGMGMPADRLLTDAATSSDEVRSATGSWHRLQGALFKTWSEGRGRQVEETDQLTGMAVTWWCFVSLPGS